MIMKIRQLVIASAIALGILSMSAHRTKAQTDDVPRWINPVILKQLQEIESIDRSKFPQTVLEEIAASVGKRLQSVTVSTSTSDVAVPEMNMPQQAVVVVKGITTHPLETRRGLVYPAGLAATVVYGADGQPFASTVVVPKAVLAEMR
jgi:hypothetical protein